MVRRILTTMLIVTAVHFCTLAQTVEQADEDVVALLMATQSINYFADSLNLISKPEQLPRILSDYLLDWKITGGICRYVTPVNLSFRKAIIDRVVREDVLQWIIDSKDSTYDALYDPVKLKEQNDRVRTIIYHGGEQGYCELPFMKLSFRDLARVRLGVLRAHRKLIDR